MQHRPIPNPSASRRIEGIKHSLNFGTKRVLVSLKGIARTRRIGSSAAGWRYSRKWKNDLIAASRTLRVSGAFWRASSGYSMKALTNPEPSCSIISNDGFTLSLAAANPNNNCKHRSRTCVGWQKHHAITTTCWRTAITRSDQAVDLLRRTGANRHMPEQLYRDQLDTGHERQGIAEKHVCS
jgi:hypothetical protein